ncbi:hypothetical protein B7494_g5524 [Chlorociboria aeruginascens]|nr:hypothetical protein B7494_g5524 [Chlorociboria aeruginascens]
MSDNGDNINHVAQAATMAVATAAAEDGKPALSVSDLNFLVECLKNTTDGSSVIVDTCKVATVLGYANPRSVGNKISMMKKKYDINFSGSNKGASSSKAKAASDAPAHKKASNAKGPNEPAIPETPARKRVTKPRTPSTKKAAALKTPKAPSSPKSPTKARAPKKVYKSSKKIAKDESESDDITMKFDEETDEEALAVKTPPTPGRRIATTYADAFSTDFASAGTSSSLKMSNVSLTPKELALLTSFIQELGGIPSTVNFQNIADRNGIKYGKNARSSFNKLLDKIMNTSATENSSSTTAAGRVRKTNFKGHAKAASNDASGDDAAGTDIDGDETYVANKRATKKSGPKNGVSKPVNGRKTPSRTARKPKTKVKIEPTEPEEEEDQDEEVRDQSESEPEDQDEEGKFSTNLALDNGSTYSSSSVPYVPTTEDIRIAKLCHMSIEDYVAWKDQNQYDPYAEAGEH